MPASSGEYSNPSAVRADSFTGPCGSTSPAASSVNRTSWGVGDGLGDGEGLVLADGSAALLGPGSMVQPVVPTASVQARTSGRSRKDGRDTGSRLVRAEVTSGW
ncbi:hypothetical protein GCM10010102_16650 [Promicromonospora citrea]|uniref:Uncharacterized protein n=1 Tax=Promicromonospora citrea TaxID=43677 RepID=A0A8H9L2S3_9MICO|nr:hypothetical protein GCM10010102_16650 [Promicromonospora citrea]